MHINRRTRRLSIELLSQRHLLAGLTVTSVRPSTQHLDVDDDGSVVSRDALLVINEINEVGSGPIQLPNATPERTAYRARLDTSNDGEISPIDSLRVINQINEQTKKTVDDFAEKSLEYFSDPNALEPLTGLPWEGFTQRTNHYTQPTAIGFYIQLLANIVSHDLVTNQIDVATATSRLDNVMDALRSLQTGNSVTYKGLFPWLAFNNGSWERAAGEYGQQIATGDNVNLTTAVGGSWGALTNPIIASLPAVQNIRAKMEAFLEAQRAGYEEMLDTNTGLFHRLHNLTTNSKAGGQHEAYGDEFRGGILFVVLQFNLRASAYTRLRVETTQAVTQQGQVTVVATHDGGAFQKVWPLLQMPEQSISWMRDDHRVYAKLALDFARTHNLPGLPSAAYKGVGDYEGNAGISALAVNRNPPRNESLAALYPLGALAMVDFNGVANLIESIVNQHPGFVTSNHGYWDSYVANGTNAVVQEQLCANVASLVVGLVGEADRHMTNYLTAHNLYGRFLSLTNAHASHPVSLIESHSNSFVFGEGGSGSGSQLTPDRTQFQIRDTAFDQIFVAFQFQAGVPLADGTLRIRYRSNVTVPLVNIELKRPGPVTQLRYRDITLEATGPSSRTLVLPVPRLPELLEVREVIFGLFGGNNGVLNVDLESILFEPNSL